ncbi:GNAT family N-acetyltransferase [Paracoccus sp. p4-l81]|uniref:GNAT family N-acetyltransferase n=1 Tax=unclassified Paracoccus (in: a-proteobacteria) TaxID=2688777 RepID=UPI0035B8928B
MNLRAAMALGWPPASSHPVGGFTIQDGAGGGSRVSAALWRGGDYDIAAAEAAMRDLGQVPLFAVDQDAAALDADLAARGYGAVDETVMLAGPVAGLTDQPPKPVSAFVVWPPLAIQRDLWAAGGIGPARLAVMDRAQGPRAALLGRVQDRAAGVGYVAVADGTAFVHALHVLPDFRRLCVARNMMRAAAAWARDQGAEQIALVVLRSNAAAIALYQGFGMAEIGGYHYRKARA